MRYFSFVLDFSFLWRGGVLLFLGYLRVWYYREQLQNIHVCNWYFFCFLIVSLTASRNFQYFLSLSFIFLICILEAQSISQWFLFHWKYVRWDFHIFWSWLPQSFGIFRLSWSVSKNSLWMGVNKLFSTE